MLVTASWEGAEVAVEVDAECQSVAALKRCVQEALPELDVETVRLEVGGRSVGEEEVLGLSEGSVIDISATPAVLAVTTLREEGCAVDFDGFCDAAVQGDLRRCRLYLDAAVVWRSGVETPLHKAVSHDRQELLELLLDAGCGKQAKDAKNEGGFTPLHYAICSQSVELVKLLVDAGCDKNAKDKYSITPLHLAIFDAPNVELVKLLIDAGCDKDAKDCNGNTPLHIATSNKNMELVKLFLDAGCDTEARDMGSNTPLHLAVGAPSVELAKLLIDAGCDLDAKSNGRTPLHLAIHMQNMTLVKLLLDAGCDKEAKTNNEDTPLHLAIYRQNMDLVKLLLDAGCNKEAKEHMGDTPLHDVENLRGNPSPSSHAKTSSQAEYCVLC